MIESFSIWQIRMSRRKFVHITPPMMLGIVMVSVALMAGVVKADVLYNNLSITNSNTYTTSAQNFIGGLGFQTNPWDVQAADDFVLSNPYSITSVTADFLNDFGTAPADGILVEFFADVGGAPSATSDFAVLTQNFTMSSFDNHLNSLLGRRFTVDLSSEDIVLGAGLWWMAVTPVDESESGERYLQVRQTGQPLIGASAYGRNGGAAHGNGYDGGYPGSGSWVEFGSFGPPIPPFQAGDLAMQIEGNLIPAPGVLALLGLAGLCRRRRD